MANPQICVFNTTSRLIDITPAAITGPGTPSAPVVLNSQGFIDSTLLGAGVTALAGENITTGALVNLYSSSGVLFVQMAFAASGSGSPPLFAPSGTPYPVLAAGFVSSAIPSGSVATISFTGIFFYIDGNNEFSASNIGAEVFLSPVTKGGVTLTRPSGTGQADQSVGYVLAYTASTKTVTVLFLAGFNDFSRISGIAQISQGGTGASTASQALNNLFGTFPAQQFWAGPVSGAAANPIARTIVNTDLSGAIFGGSGSGHNPGAVPDPGAVAGTVRFLREDSSWAPVAIPVFVGSSGSPPGHAAGLVPDPGAVPSVPLRFLREDGTWAVLAIPSNNPGLTASLGPITLLTPAATAMFRVSIYEEGTTAGAAGGGQPFGTGVFGSGVFQMANDSVQTTVSWTDDAFPRSTTPIPTPLDLSSLNAASGDLFIRAIAGQPITFTAALSNTGAPRYGVFVRLEPM